MAPIRFAVCGTAHWAEAVHLPALQAAPGVELVAVQGRNAARREVLAQKFNIAPIADFTDLFDRVDAISFAMPPDLQPEMALAAMAAGKHVILEKPAARTITDAGKMRRMITSSGVGATCFLTRRYIPEIADFIAHAKSANVSAGYASFRSGALQAGSPYVNSIWRKDPGATLWDVGPHTLTPLLEVLGPVVEIEGHRSGHEFEFRLIHAGGGRSTIEMSQGEPGGQLNERYGFSGEGKNIDVTGPAYDRVAAFGRAIAELLDGLSDNRSATFSADLALAMVGILAAASEALKSNKSIIVTPT